MFCNNCGEAVSTTEKEGTIHDNGKYACYPNVKQNDPRWTFVATEGITPEDDSVIEVDWRFVPAI